jgi:hypothetical protein
MDTTAAAKPRDEFLLLCKEGGSDDLHAMLQTLNLDGPEQASIPSTLFESAVEAAVSHKLAATLRLLLGTFSSRKWWLSAGLADAILANPNFEILDILQQFSPGIVSFEYNPFNTWLIEAMRLRKFDVASWLIAHGADPNTGMGFPDPNNGIVFGYMAFGLALNYSAPVGLVEQIIADWACIRNREVGNAIGLWRTDVLRLFLRYQVGSLDKTGSDNIMANAVESKDVEVIQLAEEIVKKWRQPEQPSDQDWTGVAGFFNRPLARRQISADEKGRVKRF